MHLGLEGKVVLVTGKQQPQHPQQNTHNSPLPTIPGGTKGIGRAIVKSFLSEGAIVHFCSRTASDVRASVETLTLAYPSNNDNDNNNKPRAIGEVVDASNPTSLQNWVASCLAQSSRIDIVIANISAFATRDTPENWQQAFQTDMTSTVTLFNAALPELKKSKGNAITISSVSGRVIDFTSHPGPYGAFKAALVHYTCQFAHKYASEGVRANSVSPGNIYIEDGVFGEIEREMPEFFGEQLGKNPLGRMGKAEEVADVCVFLASERAGFVTGSNVLVDGGLSLGVQF